MAIDTTQALSWAGVASAYACLYSQTGNEIFKFNATKYLEKATTIDSLSKELKDKGYQVLNNIDDILKVKSDN